MTELEKFKYIEYLHAVDGATFTYRDYTMLAVSDDMYKTLDENIERFRQIQMDYPQFALTIIGLEKSRLSIYKANLPWFAPTLLSGLNESKSYRKKLGKPPT